MTIKTVQESWKSELSSGGRRPFPVGRPFACPIGRPNGLQCGACFRETPLVATHNKQEQFWRQKLCWRELFSHYDVKNVLTSKSVITSSTMLKSKTCCYQISFDVNKVFDVNTCFACTKFGFYVQLCLWTFGCSSEGFPVKVVSNLPDQRTSRSESV